MNVLSLLAAALTAAGGLVLVVFSRLRTVKAQVNTARAATEAATRRAKNLVTVQTRQRTIQKEANDERTALAAAPDSDLLARANRLFP